MSEIFIVVREAIHVNETYTSVLSAHHSLSQARKATTQYDAEEALRIENYRSDAPACAPWRKNVFYIANCSLEPADA